METVLALGGLITGTVALVLVARSILNPLQQAMQRVRAPSQFLLTDFIWLLAQFQIELAIVAAYVPSSERATFIILLAYLLVSATILWMAAIGVMSRAGVRGTLRRGLFVFLLPLILVLMIATSAFFISAPVWTAALVKAAPGGAVLGPAIAIAVLIGGTSCLALVCWLLRRLTKWIVSDHQPS